MAYGHNIPTSLSNHINVCRYPVECPEYSLRKADAIERGEIVQFHIPDKNAVVLSRLTIAMMIDFCHDTIPFKILEARDIVEIYNYLGEYLEQLGQFREVEEAAAYYNKAKRFHDMLHRSVVIVSKRDPKVAETLRRNRLTEIFSDPIIDQGRGGV